MSKNLLNKIDIDVPESIKEEVLLKLKSYNKCYIFFENGRYHVTTGISLRAEYPKDYRFVGEFSSDDIYTNRDRVLNYIESFWDYPGFDIYNGTRDYALLELYKSGEITLDELASKIEI